MKITGKAPIIIIYHDILIFLSLIADKLIFIFNNFRKKEKLDNLK